MTETRKVQCVLDYSYKLGTEETDLLDAYDITVIQNFPRLGKALVEIPTRNMSMLDQIKEDCLGLIRSITPVKKSLLCSHCGNVSFDK